MLSNRKFSNSKTNYAINYKIKFDFRTYIYIRPQHMWMRVEVLYKNSINLRAYRKEKWLYHLDYIGDKCDSTLKISDSNLINTTIVSCFKLSKEFHIYLTLDPNKRFFTGFQFVLDKKPVAHLYEIKDLYYIVDLYVFCDRDRPEVIPTQIQKTDIKYYTFRERTKSESKCILALVLIM
ncbi:hypothetical protein RF11_11081 [Thelohanellus kitauei]|uniref:Uncharacterized protein n=1 Tax=Thelohanellus kitauei TaxID=669202 RepID=A0A0C2MQ91_THEKT|nr:hypothetical protein RF11_11081 [Thelohanellus kitauei]